MKFKVRNAVGNNINSVPGSTVEFDLPITVNGMSTTITGQINLPGIPPSAVAKELTLSGITLPDGVVVQEVAETTARDLFLAASINAEDHKIRAAFVDNVFNADGSVNEKKLEEAEETAVDSELVKMGEDARRVAALLPPQTTGLTGAVSDPQLPAEPKAKKTEEKVG